MDSAQRLLFGDFPRALGVTTPDWEDTELRQYLIHSEKEFNGILEKVEGNRNIYASISAYKPVKKNGSFEGNAVLADKVSFDFDSPAKADPEDYPDLEPEERPNWEHPQIPEMAKDYWVIDEMRRKESIREAVLGDVCYNVRELASACMGREIPVFGVFSGFGVHVHQLWKPTMSRPGDKMLSTCNKWVSELKLALSDERASGRPYRIMRVPNVERIDHELGEPTGIYTVPLRAAEMAQIQPEDLMTLSASPRPNIGSEPRERPRLKVHEDHLGQDGAGQDKMRPLPKETTDDELAATLVKQITRMPCVYERALGINPPNDVRVKLGIMFLNAGYTPEEATQIFSRLGWVDFDRDITKYQLKKLKESGKGDWSCRTMAGKGLCTRADKKTSCPTYGYRGGNKPW